MKLCQTIELNAEKSACSLVIIGTQRFLIFPVLFLALLLGVTACSNSVKKSAADVQEVMRLAKEGDAAAQHNLGTMYRKGLGVTQDYKEAVKWYRQAANQGYAAAQANLGVMHDKGDGITQDHKEAVRWYRLAASQDDAKAQVNLGVMYAIGKGVPQDFVLAYMWTNLAAASGNKMSVDLRDGLAQELTAQQLKKAQKLSKECKAKNYKNC